MESGFVTLSPLQALGIPVALVGSVFLAFGAEFQHRGVNKVDAASHYSAKTGLGIGQLLALARRPSWLLGTLMLGIAIVLQLISLFLAPLTVVQPLGALALVITAVLNARLTRTRLTRRAIRAILLCVGGIAVFVGVAAVTTTSVPIQTEQLVIVLIILAFVLAILAVGFVFLRKRSPTVFYILAGGVLFGFVATLAKVVIARVQTIVLHGFQLEPGDGLTIVALVGIIVTALAGTYLVQTAYSSGPPELVVAGLTVIDPMVGVTIGIVVLGEATAAPWWAGVVFVLAGAVAVFGVFQLSRRSSASGGAV
ncbi:multidrug DMT transporter permease [Cryobacterium sp. TMT2-10]|uniref:DMT family transporter n=1 Tax=Cryobacterium sp. TMT2-10 TaxID=1259244 RepID=UPI00106C5AB1|nr:DMT family transporter [Cryobacterium sp. TMT2-10]TFD35789.1 multidrug DMT transporter permease [Cryobacterium sp. TMT2-10]